MAATEAQAVPTVLLRHEMPDGSVHVDWMLADNPACPGTADAPVGGPLTTFRLPASVADMESGDVLAAERSADHRSAYLSYQGPVSGGRGAVQRLRRGRANLTQQDQGRLKVCVEWEGGTGQAPTAQELMLAPDDTRGGRLWSITCVSRNAWPRHND